MLLFFDEQHKRRPHLSLKKQVDHTLQQTKTVLRSRNVALFLLAFFFFNDAISTLANNFSIFLEQVWGIADTAKTYLMLLILVMCAIGGLVSGYLADRFGHRRVLMIILLSWLVLLPIMAYARSFTLFVILTAILGLWFGANWTVSRTMMSHVAPKGQHNLAFTYYSLAERASSFVGPLVWGGIVSGLFSLGSERYRIGMVVLTVFILFGVVTLHKVVEDNGSGK
jgi:UMF1 family MFS transporter